MAENILSTLEDYFIDNQITPDLLRDNIIPTVCESNRVVEQLPTLGREISPLGDSGPPGFICLLVKSAVLKRKGLLTPKTPFENVI